MAHTKKSIAGNVNNGSVNTFSYSGSFDVFKASEVEVELDNVGLTFTTGTINESASPREYTCLLYTSPSPRDGLLSRMPSSA